MKSKFLILFLIWGFTAKAGDSLLFKIEVASSFLTTDNLNNIYFIDQNNQIIKFSANDATTITYSNKNLGRPVSIDASNPMKLLVFYPDFNSIVLLDNKLAELSMIRFNNFNSVIYQPVTISKEAESDYFWIYDDITRKLFKLDESGVIIAESEPFDILFNFEIKEPELFNSGDKLYIALSTSEILVFDTYANFINIITQLPNKLQQIADGNLITIHENKIYSFNLSSLQVISFKNDINNSAQVNIKADRLYLRDAGSISVIQFTK